MAFLGFDKLKSRLSSQKGVRNPGGLAASIGRKKYGGPAMAASAASRKSLRGAPQISRKA